MDEGETKLEMRLYALEVFAANQFSISCLMNKGKLSPLEIFKMIKRQLIEGARAKTWPGRPAVEGDTLSAELEERVTLLADMAGEQIEHVLKHQKG